MSETQQKALFLALPKSGSQPEPTNRFGGGDLGEPDFGSTTSCSKILVTRSTSIPTPGPGELLVKNGAVALNPVDWKIQKQGFAIETFPALIGLDLAGTVEAVGEGVTGVGAPHLTERQAAFQQYTIVLARFSARVPDSILIEQVASVPEGAITAAVGLYQAEQFGAGLVAAWEQNGQAKYNKKPIFVLGGASAVGVYVIQFAKLSGFSPVIATASPHNAAYLKSLGATHVLDRHLDAAALKKEVAGITTLPFDIIFDAISEPDTQKLGYERLADKGTFVLTLPSSLGEATGGKKFQFTRGMPFMPGNELIGEALYTNLYSYLETGAVKPLRVEVLPVGLNGIAGGLDRLSEGKVSAVKLVLRPHETS